MDFISRGIKGFLFKVWSLLLNFFTKESKTRTANFYYSSGYYAKFRGKRPKNLNTNTSQSDSYIGSFLTSSFNSLSSLPILKQVLKRLPLERLSRSFYSKEITFEQSNTYHFGSLYVLIVIFTFAVLSLDTVLRVDTSFAGIFVQNFTNFTQYVEQGLQIYKYEVQQTDIADTQAQFDAQTYSAGNFEVGQNDLASYTDSGEYLALNHYGDNKPDTSEIDWWDDDADSLTQYNWRYRRCFDIDHNDANAEDLYEYQSYLDIDTATLVTATKMLADGADIRFVDENNNLLDHYIVDDMNESSTRIWLQSEKIEGTNRNDLSAEILAMGPVLWLDALDINGTGLPTTDGTPITNWVDKSGNGFDQPGTGGATFDAAASGIAFNDTAQPFAGTYDITNLDRLSIFSVFTDSAGGVANGTHFETTTPRIALCKDSTCGAGTTLSNNELITSTETPGINIFNFEYLSGGTSSLYLNSQQILTFTETPAFAGTQNLYIGDDSTGGNRLVAGEYAHEMLIFNKDLTDYQRELVETYLAQKWNLETKLPQTTHNGVTKGDTTNTVCMYYGYVPYLDNPIPANLPATGSDRAATFDYSTREPLYYVTQESGNGSVTNFASYQANNDITVSGYADTLNKYEFAAFPSGATASYDQTSVFSTTAPITSKSNQDAGDNLVPASFAGTAFVYRMDRGTNTFSFFSPYCDADIEVRNENDLIVTGGTFTLTQGTATTLTTNNNGTTGIANDSAVIVETTNTCPVYVTHVAGAQDSFVFAPAATEWYGVGSGNLEIAALNDGTNVTVFRSNGTSVSTTLNRGDNIRYGEAGSQGSEPAHRVVADDLIGVNALADGDGTEGVTFLRTEDLGYTYRIPSAAQYIAIATLEGVTTNIDHHSASDTCGDGTPDLGSYSAVSPGATFPGKVLIAGGNEGDCLVSDNPMYLYYEDSALGDETNTWNFKQNAQFVFPEPSATAVIQKGAWDLGQGGTNAWTRRAAVTITNNAAADIDEYQVALDLATLVPEIFTTAQTDGGDIRVAGAQGDGTGARDYFLDLYDSAAGSGTVWVQTDNVTASGGTQTVYIYYRHFNLTDLSTTNPEIWLDGSDINANGISDNTDGNLATWTDKSGNGNDATQVVVADQPVVNGGVVEFRGDADINTVGEYLNIPNVDIQSFFFSFDNATTGNLAGTFPGGHSIIGQAGVNLYTFISTNAASYNYDISFDGQVGETGRYSVDNAALSVFGTNIVGGQVLPTATQVNLYGEYLNPQTGWDYLGALDYTGGTAVGRPDLDMLEFIGFTGVPAVADYNLIQQYLEDKWKDTQSTSGLTTTGNIQNVFTTTALRDTYYVVSDNTVNAGSMSVISYADGNVVELDADGDATIVNAGQSTTFPVGAGIDEDSIYSATGPLAISFEDDTTDSAIPISWYGTTFGGPANRNADQFSFYAPFGAATVQIQSESGGTWTTENTVNVVAGGQAFIAEDIVNGNAFRIISSEKILAFHNNDANDSKVLYPTDQTLESSGNYELWGVASGTLLITATNPGDTAVTVYDSAGGTTSFTLNAANNYYYAAGGFGAQGTGNALHIVADGPISGTTLADSDGGETATFYPQKEFDSEYIIPDDTQYFAIATRDPSVTCQVFDETDTEVTTGPAAMDNVPPQTSGALALPFPNKVFIGGNDTGDGAFFTEGYSLRCSEPVFMYYEKHFGAITEETTALTYAQGRKRAEFEPTVQDPDVVNEEGLYYEAMFSAFDANAGYWEFTFDADDSHTYFEKIDWFELISTRAAENITDQVQVFVAYADEADCSLATYSTFTALTEVQLSTSTDTSPTFEDLTLNNQESTLDDIVSDNECLRYRIYLGTGDEAYSPVINISTLYYYDPINIESQTGTPIVTQTANTSGTDIRRRTIKVATSDPNYTGSTSYLTYQDISNGGNFNNLEFEFIERDISGASPVLTTNQQFDFVPTAFPATPPEVDAPNFAPIFASESPVDSNNEIIVYTTHDLVSAGESVDMTFKFDILNSDGPLIVHDFRLALN